MEQLAKGDRVMEKAMTAQEFLRQDEQMRMLYEARQKALHDYASAMHNAEDRGRREGMREVAIKLVRKGMSVSEVEELTGLSGAEVEEIRRSLDGAKTSP